MPTKIKHRREAAVKRQKGVCAYCDKQFTDDNPPTAEHVKPKSRGGSNSFRNIIAVCEPCNAERANKPYPFEYEGRSQTPFFEIFQAMKQKN